jgi:hypothetical protein
MLMKVIEHRFGELNLSALQSNQIKNPFCDPVHFKVLMLIGQINHFTDFF